MQVAKYNKTKDGKQFAVGDVYWMIRYKTTAIFLTQVIVTELDRTPGYFWGQIRGCPYDILINGGFEYCFVSFASARKVAKTFNIPIYEEPIEYLNEKLGPITLRSLDVN